VPRTVCRILIYHFLDTDVRQYQSTEIGTENQHSTLLIR